MKSCCCIPKRRGVLGWIVPAIVLVILPKCPLCLAAYAAAIGVGLSFETASVLRTAIQLVCIAVLVLLAIRLVRSSR